MARSGITYDQVAAAADRLLAEDQKPTIDRVRVALGNTGSPNTIHRHLNTWKASSPVVERTVPALPVELQSALVREIQRQRGEARADALDEKNIAMENADRLADTGELLEAEIGDVRETNQALLTEQQRLNAQLDERGGELTRLSGELTREREGAEGTRTQLARALARIEALDRQSAAAKSAEATHLETLQTVAIERTKREGLEAVVVDLKGAVEDQKTGLEKRLANEKAAHESALDKQAAVSADRIAQLEKILGAAEKREAGLTNQVNKLTEKLTD